MNNKNIKSLPVKVKQEDLDKINIEYKLIRLEELWGLNETINYIKMVYNEDEDDTYEVGQTYVDKGVMRNRGLDIDHILKSDINDNNIIVFNSIGEAVKALNKLIKVEFIEKHFREYKYEDVFN